VAIAKEAILVRFTTARRANLLRGGQLAASRVALVVPVVLALGLLRLSRGAGEPRVADGPPRPRSTAGSPR
jgi:hypothetical protein